MSKVTIILEDKKKSRGEVSVHIEFDPPLEESSTETTATYLAARFMQLLEDESGNS